MKRIKLSFLAAIGVLMLMTSCYGVHGNGERHRGHDRERHDHDGNYGR